MEPPFDLKRAHRWFGVELNNHTWALLEKQDRTPDENDRLVHAAHASVHHWLQVGTEANRVRGLVLLASVYTAVDLPARAIAYAEDGLALSEAHAGELNDFDRATILGAAAHAHRLAGDSGRAKTHYARAREIVEGFDESERRVFEQFYPPEGITEG